MGLGWAQQAVRINNHASTDPEEIRIRRRSQTVVHSLRLESGPYIDSCPVRRALFAKFHVFRTVESQ